ncbi:TrbI/VirB10 family protein [Pontixanthobacter luteolus]|nr:TrbI/VirB10 family protein [Pontixanthobacter luteolus]
MADAQNIADAENDIRPVVATAPASNAGMWVFFAILLLGGVWLFSALSANRAQIQAPATAFRPAPDGGRISAPPPLALPNEFSNAQPVARPRTLARPIAAPVTAQTLSPPRTAIMPAPQPAPPNDYYTPVDPNPRPAVVFDQTLRAAAPDSEQSVAVSADRVRAGRLAKPSQTIPQGTVIPAVLETALDSTRSGAARALVQRDVFSFDGTRILIQRGSRLYGEYDPGLEPGQNRALVQWTRLIRPDGVTIALNSPSSDPLGRAGVKGKVDSKFLQRFGGAILQTVLDLGVAVGTNEISSGEGVVVALPGSTQNIQVQDRERVQRTLKVKHGTSVSVFVARDLDFSTVDS